MPTKNESESLRIQALELIRKAHTLLGAARDLVGDASEGSDSLSTARADRVKDKLSDARGLLLDGVEELSQAFASRPVQGVAP